MNPKIYKAKKVFNSHVSVRDYIVDKCIQNNQVLIIEYNGAKMTLTPEKLKHSYQFHKIPFRSKFNDKEYELVDFKFIPDDFEKQISLI